MFISGGESIGNVKLGTVRHRVDEPLVARVESVSGCLDTRCGNQQSAHKSELVATGRREFPRIHAGAGLVDEGQHYRLAGLNLLAAIVIYWNTVRLDEAV